MKKESSMKNSHPNKETGGPSMTNNRIYWGYVILINELIYLLLINNYLSVLVNALLIKKALREEFLIGKLDLCRY